MTPKQYQKLIDASGGFTPPDRRRGDRPQPLSQADEAAFDKAWTKAAAVVKAAKESPKRTKSAAKSKT